jgi:hypothetical protein
LFKENKITPGLCKTEPGVPCYLFFGNIDGKNRAKRLTTSGIQTPSEIDLAVVGLNSEALTTNVSTARTIIIPQWRPDDFLPITNAEKK